MKFADAIDLFVADWKAAGRMNSPASERTYRHVLALHGEDVEDRPPSKPTREDCKRTLARWGHPNSQRVYRSALVSFYRWAMEEGLRTDNPAEQTRRPKPRKSNVYRITRDEAARMLDVAEPGRERRAVTLMLCTGLRVSELIGLQGRHLRRAGWVWVSADIGKGGKERWMPVLEDLVDVVAEITERVGDSEHVIPSRQVGHFGDRRGKRDDPLRPTTRGTVGRLVANVAKRAEIHAHITPHTLRHSYGDHVARHAGLRAAQALLGHESVETTQSIYVGEVTLDELAIALRGLTYRRFPAGERTPTSARRPGARPDAS